MHVLCMYNTIHSLNLIVTIVTTDLQNWAREAFIYEVYDTCFDLRESLHLSEDMIPARVVCFISGQGMSLDEIQALRRNTAEPCHDIES